ncbi:jg18463 [Pararge aegeria aegeria]|uniref:Jg18463 protein n=1 Tax=Pararge aegeria aegeria TaxID=348720 RepID=A0A8S4RL47_9NEOP|nr:jg18463 [Pararge aegeria aegeria]
MTDQQKGYGLGIIILGIRLPCLESSRRRAVNAPARTRAPSSPNVRRAHPIVPGRLTRPSGPARMRSAALTPASLYPHITSTYIRRDKFDQKLILLMTKTIQGSYFSIWTF